MFAEEFPERGSIAEIKLVGNLLDGQLGIAQKNGRLDNQKVGNGFAGAFAGIVLADFGQVMGGYVQFSGIEADRMFLENMGFEQGKIAAAKESRPGNLLLLLYARVLVILNHLDDFGMEQQDGMLVDEFVQSRNLGAGIQAYQPEIF